MKAAWLSDIADITTCTSQGYHVCMFSVNLHSSMQQRHGRLTTLNSDSTRPHSAARPNCP
jgi:hypothetical protein